MKRKAEIDGNLKRLEVYLDRAEKNRVWHEPTNKRVYQEAREMAAWLSLYRHGSADAKDMASIIISAW